jgi:hypothetical protein
VFIGHLSLDGATLLQTPLGVIQYPVHNAPEGYQYPVDKLDTGADTNKTRDAYFKVIKIRRKNGITVVFRVNTGFDPEGGSTIFVRS